jgi:hypothetical protein
MQNLVGTVDQGLEKNANGFRRFNACLPTMSGHCNLVIGPQWAISRHGACREPRPLQGQHFKKFVDRRYVVAFGLDRSLANDQAGLTSIGMEQMQGSASAAAVPAAIHRFAIGCDHPGDLVLQRC